VCSKDRGCSQCRSAGRSACTYRVDVGGIDVLVHRHDPATGIGAGLAIRSQHGRLLGVSWIHLLDGNDVEQTPGAGLVIPHALNAGKTGSLYLLPDHRRLDDPSRHGEVRRRPRGDRERHDRIVAMIDTPDLDDGLLACFARIVSHELAEWSFEPGLVAVNFPLKDEL
jgi:hypothetical protein